MCCDCAMVSMSACVCASASSLKGVGGGRRVGSLKGPTARRGITVQDGDGLTKRGVLRVNLCHLKIRAAADAPVRARVRCFPRGACAMRRERRHIAVPTPSGPRASSHPPPTRGRADPQRGEETAGISIAGALPCPRACLTARGNPTRATELASGQVHLEPEQARHVGPSACA